MVGYSARMRLPCPDIRAFVPVHAPARFAALALAASAGLALQGCDRTGTSGSDARADQGRVAPAAAEAGPGTEAGTAAAAPPAAAPLGPVHRIEVLDLDGRRVSLGTLAGRPMIIEIWATWCGPCRKNRETVHRLEPRFPEKLAVVGVSVDAGSAGRSPAETVRAFLKSNPANEFEFLATPAFLEFIKERNPSSSIPKTLYVDSKGRVADLSEGVQSAKWLEAMARNLK
jgi:thiol-disulfide isomerase/thioredoxin